VSDERPLGVREFQERIEAIYFAKDSARGAMGTFAWFVEEVGELSRALRKGDPKNLEEEFADCFAWLVSLASIAKIDMERAAAKYADGCPRCHATPCACGTARRGS
jgi:NTP pyrophosphatase (non-canonical NTP hydrolase)